MKVTVLGSAAAEGIPALFCNCDNCKKAAARGGKDIRTRAQVLVNEDLLIDWPADTYMHKLLNNLDLSKVETLLVTHSHSDHFRPLDFGIRGAVYAHAMSNETLNVYCNAAVKRAYDVSGDIEKIAPAIGDKIVFHTAEPLKLFNAGKYEICAFRAQHMASEQALYYYIRERDTGKALLQVFDTGKVYPETYAFMEKNNLKADVVLLDCTMLKHEIDDNSTHMNLKACIGVTQNLKEKKLLGEGARVFVTHFSHNGNMLHEEIESYLAPYGIGVAYDSMKVEV